MDISTLISGIMAAHPAAVITIITFPATEADSPPAQQGAPLRPEGRRAGEKPSHAPGDSDETIIMRMEEAGEGLQKISAWGKLLTIGVAELRRAAKMKVLSSSKKSDGKDSGADMVAAPDLLRFVKMRQAVLSGRAEKPTWWGDVVKIQ